MIDKIATVEDAILHAAVGPGVPTAIAAKRAEQARALLLSFRDQQARALLAMRRSELAAVTQRLE